MQNESKHNLVQTFYGRNSFEEALKAKIEMQEICYANEAGRKWLEERLPKGARIKQGIPREIQTQNHQGIVFKASHSFYIKDWSPRDSKGGSPFILLCNHLEDIQNLGNITRVAAAMGVDLIVHENRRSVEMNAVGLKISAGLGFRMKFLKVSNLTPFLVNLRQAEYEVVGLEASSNALSLYEWNPRRPLALVLGAEGSGMAKSVKDQLDFRIRIPMDPGVESLNVSQAAGIAMSWIYRTAKS